MRLERMLRNKKIALYKHFRSQGVPEVYARLRAERIAELTDRWDWMDAEIERNDAELAELKAEYEARKCSGSA